MIAKSLLSAIALTLSMASASSALAVQSSSAREASVGSLLSYEPTIASDVGIPRFKKRCFETSAFGQLIEVECSKTITFIVPKDSGYRMSERQIEKLHSGVGGKLKSPLQDLSVPNPFDPKDLGLLRNDFYKPYGTQPTLVR